MPNPSERTRPYQVGSDQAIAWLEQGFGLDAVCQQKIGAFMTLMATFERMIEVAAWAVLEVGMVAGTRPFTDKVGISDILGKIRARKKGKGGHLGQAIELACEAADDLVAYRNAIAHGWLIPGLDGEPSFISNTSYHGETRGRPSQDAYVSENLLDLAIDAAFVLTNAARGIYLACSGINPFHEAYLEDHLAELTRARGAASELRNLRDLMNSDRY